MQARVPHVAEVLEGEGPQEVEVALDLSVPANSWLLSLRKNMQPGCMRRATCSYVVFLKVTSISLNRSTFFFWNTTTYYYIVSSKSIPV